MTDDERREKTRLKVRRWRERHAARLSAEQSERRAKRLDMRNQGRESFRLIEFYNELNLPAKIIVIRDGAEFKVPEGLRVVHEFAPTVLMTREEARATARMYRCVWLR